MDEAPEQFNELQRQSAAELVAGLRADGDRPILIERPEQKVIAIRAGVLEFSIAANGCVVVRPTVECAS